MIWQNSLANPSTENIEETTIDSTPFRVTSEPVIGPILMLIAARSTTSWDENN